MKKFFHEKPWYFALSALGFILEPVLKWFVMYFFDEDAATRWLNKTIFISDIIPWAFCAIILLVCGVVYFIQLQQQKSQTVQNDEITVLKEKLTDIVEQEDYVESMQAFQYTVKSDRNNYRYYKLAFLTGVASEQIEINTILQTYFSFPNSFFRRLLNIARDYDKYINENDPNLRAGYYSSFCDRGRGLCEQILKTLNAIESSNDIQESHCDLYRVLAKLMPTISEQAFESFLENKDIEESLIKQKKTGILGSLIISDLYVFKNQNSISKRNRIYFSFPYNPKKHIVLLGSINATSLPEGDHTILKTYCRHVVDRVFAEENVN